jgi:nitrite reductase/ring-hydroxylating ferredoxin subunit
MTQRHVVGRLDAVPPGTGQTLMMSGTSLAAFNTGGRIFAVEAFSPPAGAPLTKVTFGVADAGAGPGPPALKNVRSHPAFVSGGIIEVEL